MSMKSLCSSKCLFGGNVEDLEGKKREMGTTWVREESSWVREDRLERERMEGGGVGRSKRLAEAKKKVSLRLEEEPTVVWTGVGREEDAAYDYRRKHEPWSEHEQLCDSTLE